jgi:hypothetical protein
MDARLRFATIHIYEFAPIIGDNPFVSRGVPIAMGHQVQELVMLLERYELERGPRRTRRQLMIHRKVRQAM